MTIKPWSISTAVRNPLRIRSFLLIIAKEIEGKENSKKHQAVFQTLLIKHKLYKPDKVGGKWVQNYDNPNYEFTFEEARKIAELQDYKGGLDMRGRQSMSPLKELGFILVDDKNKVKISGLGKEFIKEDYDLEKIFLKGLLRWQYPNPLNRSYGAEFNIRPLMATMHLINEVNKLSNKASGISREEFNIFAHTLIDATNITSYAEAIMELRKLPRDERQQRMEEFVQNFYEDNSIISESKKYKSLRDYGDNIRRYFRLTKLFNFKGDYVNLEPRRKREIDLLLEKYDGSADNFDKKIYMDYIANPLILPWETKENLLSIAKDIIKDIEDNFDITKLEIKDYNNFNAQQLSEYIEYLRDYRTEQQREKDHDESQGIEALNQYILEFENLYDSRKKLSIELERLTTLALNAVNDAIKIKPNYPVGDDGEPTFTAPAGVADIECYYGNFDSICEVTMLKGRDQWFNEGQPVMRHLRDFEDKSSKDSYCIFIAPSIHRDTANTFFMANKYEYEGKKQKIIPLTIKQFVEVLKTVRQLKEKGRRIEHQEFQGLLDSIIDYCNEDKIDSTKWQDGTDKQLEKWSQSLLN